MLVMRSVLLTPLSLMAAKRAVGVAGIGGASLAFSKAAPPRAATPHQRIHSKQFFKCYFFGLHAMKLS
jgi:hypothetical protein